MLKRAFERVGFTVTAVEPCGIEYEVFCSQKPRKPLTAIEEMELRFCAQGTSYPGTRNYIRIGWTVAFERWYQEEIGTDG